MRVEDNLVLMFGSKLTWFCVEASKLFLHKFRVGIEIDLITEVSQNKLDFLCGGSNCTRFCVGRN